MIINLVKSGHYPGKQLLRSHEGCQFSSLRQVVSPKIVLKIWKRQVTVFQYKSFVMVIQSPFLTKMIYALNTIVQTCSGASDHARNYKIVIELPNGNQGNDDYEIKVVFLLKKFQLWNEVNNDSQVNLLNCMINFILPLSGEQFMR